MSNFCIYVIESRKGKMRTFYPWPSEAFSSKREALRRCQELREQLAPAIFI